MAQKTRPDTWMNTCPTVVFMVPAEGAEEYSRLMGRLTIDVIEYLDLEAGTITLIGLIAATAQAGTEGILFLEEMGIDTRSLTLLVLWGETAKAVNLEDAVPEECGVGRVVLSRTGVILPALRMPSLDGDWWLDPLHQAYASSVYAGLVKNGKDELDGSEPYIFVSESYAWN